MKVRVILFSDFETLDVFGPVEILGKLENIAIEYYSQSGGLVKNGDGVSIETKQLEDPEVAGDILFIPGGMGTRQEINNTELLNLLRIWGEKSDYVLSVCTGSACLLRQDC